MDIRIHSLTLHNFKGVRDASFEFAGENARIEGENGAGKSSVFDAFVWLLFGKDHAGQDWTNFDLKPIDPETREPFHGLEHWVEAELLVDGVVTRVRRVVLEDWVKPRGQAEKVLQGHKQLFFINGVDTGTLRAYESAIHQWIDERVFKLITNPLYFIDDRYTSWQDRRKAICSMIGQENQEALRAQFADLVGEMQGEPMESFRKRIAAAKRENRKRLDEATAGIAALKKAVPEEVDAAGAAAGIAEIVSRRDEKISVIQEKISRLDEKISDAISAGEARRAEIDGRNREILAYRIKMGDFIAERLKAAQRTANERSRRIDEARRKAERIQATIDEARIRKDKAAQAVEDYTVQRGEEALRLRELGQRHTAERDKAFQFDGQEVCPACGRPFPEEQIEQEREVALERFNEARRVAMQKIVNEATGIKEHISKLDGWISGRKEELQKMEAEIIAANTALSAAEEEIEDAQSVPEVNIEEAEKAVRRSPEYLEMVETERKMRAVMESMASSEDGARELLAERRKLEADIQLVRNAADDEMTPLKEVQAVAGERERILRMIDEQKADEARFADEVARLERLEDRAAQYVKAEIDSMDGAISKLFRVARWKMFSVTLEGGLKDMCEVTSPDGVPYRSMNDAQKILCGLDVIRVFSEHYGCSAPIFIDNAESITRSEFDTDAQVIRLVVTPGASLTMVGEGRKA